MIDEELVQLLTPEGERVENSDYESTLNGDEIFGLYRDMVDRATPVQRVDVAPAPGTTRALGPDPGTRGRADRRRAGPRAQGLHVSHLPRTRHRLVPRRTARGHAATLSRGEQRRLGSTEVPPLGAHGRARATRRLHAVGYAMGIQRDGAEEAVDGVLRRRRLEPG